MRYILLIVGFIAIITPAWCQEGAVSQQEDAPIIEQELVPLETQEVVQEAPAVDGAKTEIPIQEETISEESQDEEAPVPPTAADLEAQHRTGNVKIQGIDKVTARVSTLMLQEGHPVTFGKLDITLRQCWKSLPEETPESKALLEIWEHNPDQEKKRIFYGWMFASSPSISALEHPVYDVVVLECTRPEGKMEK